MNTLSEALRKEMESEQRLRLALLKLEIRLEEACVKHPVFAHGTEEAFRVIEDEFKEFCRAIESETPERQVDEALDVAATCLRFVRGDHRLE